MTKHFTRFDDVLIDRLFQPLADWMDRQWALGPQGAARWCLDLASLAWICAEADALAASVAGHDVRIAAARGLLVVLGLWALTILRGVFRKADGGQARPAAQANPLRPGMQLHRVICLVWMAGLAVKAFAAPTGLESFALLGVSVFATAAVYLGACSNPPPAWRGSRDAGRSLATAAGGL